MPGCLSADCRAVTFGLVADIHYADIDNAIGRHYREAEKRLADCVRTMNALQPDFLIELGDFKDQGRLSVRGWGRVTPELIASAGIR